MDCKPLFYAQCVFIVYFSSVCGFQFASYYQNDMVLQREPHRSVIWGYGSAGAIVNISIIQDVISTRVDKKGVWSVTLRPHPPGGPVQIQGVEDNHGLLKWILLKNVLFGDVWICSGQSNMQFTMTMVFNASKEISEAENYPNIRVMTPAQKTSNHPLEDLSLIEQPWSIASKDSIGGPSNKYFSAVCWLFGRRIYDAINVPIGLIASDWGGTRIEAWSSKYALKTCGIEKSICNMWDKQRCLNIPHNNSVLWNAMIHPFLKMTIKGAIWYQGEANTLYNADKYACTFPAMIKDWRKSWHKASHGQTDVEFPFGFVQLSTQNKTDVGSFAKIRWHQTAEYGFVPNKVMPQTFMAVALDLPDNNSPYGSIHPRDKQDVASRLAYGALKFAYNKSNNPQGPIIQHANFTKENNVVLIYSNDQNIVAEDYGNFKVCCNFLKCDIYQPDPSPNWLAAPILSSTHQTVTLDMKSCNFRGGKPSIIRYAWALEPCRFKKCSVYNNLGLPAPPFVIGFNN